MDKTLPRDFECAESVPAGAVDAVSGGYPHPPVPTDAESVDMVAAAEARIATSLAFFLELFLQKICMIPRSCGASRNHQGYLVRIHLQGKSDGGSV